MTNTEGVNLSPTFSESLRVWLRIAALSFGGPAGQIAVMHRILVEEKRWLSESRFLHALNYCMLLPGPEAMQLVTYSGWLLNGVRGGLVAGLLFGPLTPNMSLLLAILMVGLQAPTVLNGVLAVFGQAISKVLKPASDINITSDAASFRPTNQILTHFTWKPQGLKEMI